MTTRKNAAPKPTRRGKAPPAKRPSGRPAATLDWSAFDRLCGIQCTLREVASYFDVHEDTIEAACRREHGQTFGEYAESRRGKGRASLRRKQFELALAGDKTMLIWLGKQYLGQSDKSTTELTGKDGGPMEMKGTPLTDAERAARVADILAIALARRAEADARADVSRNESTPAR